MAYTSRGAARKPAKGQRPRKAAPGRPRAATKGRKAANGPPRKATKAQRKARATAACPRGRAKARPAAPRKAASGDTPAFGRAGTAGKADGDAAVQAWLASVKPEHRGLVQRLDRLVGETVPGVRRAVKWSMPMYGLPGKGWFAHLASFKGHVRLGFVAGSSLDPEPPEGEGKTMRAAHLRDAKDLDEAQVRAWLQQAAATKGWGTVA